MGAFADVCGTIVTIIFIVTNILLSLIGIGAISIGGFGVHYGRTQGGGSAALGGGALLIVAGVLILLVIGLAVFGAVSRSRIALGIYIFLLVLIIVLQVVAIIVIFALRGRISSNLDKSYLADITSYTATTHSSYDKTINERIDNLQREYKCCGWNALYDNWKSSPYYTQKGKYPSSCECKQSQKSCFLSSNTSQYVWFEVCRDNVIEYIYNNGAILGGFGATIAAIQIAPLALAIGLIVLISLSSH